MSTAINQESHNTGTSSGQNPSSDPYNEQDLSSSISHSSLSPSPSTEDSIAQFDGQLQYEDRQGDITSKEEDNRSLQSDPIQDTNTSPKENNTSATHSHNNKSDNSGAFNPNDEDNALQRTGTRYFSPKLKKARKDVIYSFIFTNVVLAIFAFTIFSLFWGVNYKNFDRAHKVQILAVIQDEGITSPNISTIIPIAAAVPTIAESSMGTYHIYNSTGFMDKFKLQSNDEIDAKVIHEVYGEKYWFAINIKPNATQALYDAIAVPNAPSFNTSQYFEAVTITARDPTNYRQLILPLLQDFEARYSNYYTSTYFPQFLNNLTTFNNITTVNMTNIALAGTMNFYTNDIRSFTERVLIAPLLVGVAYCLLLTFFQFLIYSQLHQEVSALLKPNHILIYRNIMLWLTMFFASLFFCTVSAIFQIDFTPAFGRGGFVVYWMTTWLFMVACGGTNENMVSILFTLFGPRFLGIWILSFIILNITPTFYPMVMANVFYRYGYMMPVHNAIDIYRVIFLDLSKHKMGRNYGLLIAWIAMNAVALPLVFKFLLMVITRREKKEKELAAAAEEAKLKN
ncbi:uncharacterized protein NDAI_0C02910 [Naumovozyma dairenensis CBS 421]|uniref:DUF3533 domain-containing protein n=1 Tax=Naumovozyma dairenensis (strain ATCC 10597 / BCRC 20456 / CBS 421 / NBRC 0211 / NRRL Y-12639) TaxID=1071378 RepID=G0W840_NAUDC|nr:hypothetical protein NDAI_0C02910 [Naumovozyma dairenensis CBS 421]CCD23951.1 hypothetical protein NDAI_0C02910 [Naumovozyma dairenensis CBS 421]